jgi:hypothetical protein
MHKIHAVQFGNGARQNARVDEEIKRKFERRRQNGRKVWRANNFFARRRLRIIAAFAVDNSGFGHGKRPDCLSGLQIRASDLSGGRMISGSSWQIFDEKLGIYRAKIALQTNTRQLYINNERATRARTNINLSDFKRTNAGYLAPNERMASWKNVSEIEVVGYNEWRAHRCLIEKIEAKQIFIKQPCWLNAQRDRWRIENLQRIENALELLDEPGEWYLDRAENFLYYKPRPNENLKIAQVVVPFLEKIIEAAGEADKPIEFVEFRNITFSFATWLAPSSADGYALLQAGVRRTGANGTLTATPANVSFERAENVTIENCRFEHLGAAALSFDGGSQNNRIVGNVFRDIASHAIALGNVFAPEQSDPRLRNENNRIVDNFIEDIGADYEDACAIFAGYVARTTIEHNTIQNVPYTGISVGWGWGKKSYMRENRINFNRIENFMLRLKDGGAIYTLSAQPDSEAIGNFIRTPSNASNGGHAGLYFDEGTAFYTARDNAFDLPDAMKRGWLNLAHNLTAHDITVENVITTTKQMATTGRTPETNGKTPPNFVLKNVRVVSRAEFPQAARAIIENAGRRLPNAAPKTANAKTPPRSE